MESKKIKKPYGFIVTNVAGQGFKRWFNTETTIISFNENGEIPGELKRISDAQSYMTFSKAFNYSKIRAKALSFDFKELTEEDFKKKWNPVSDFFKKIFK